MKRPIVALLLAAFVVLGTITLSGQSPETPRQGFLSALKVGQSVSVKEVAGRFEVMLDRALTNLSHKIVEVGPDSMTIEDVGGLIETRIPVYSIKAIENHKIRINKGKGDKDRFVLFGKTFSTALRTHISAHSKNRWLFQTRRSTKYTTRRVQQIVKVYAEQAGVTATPHTFRHQCITWLTRHSGLADAELQLITGHARRETLAIYQHVALDGELEAKYQEAIKKADL